MTAPEQPEAPDPLADVAGALNRIAAALERLSERSAVALPRAGQAPRFGGGRSDGDAEPRPMRSKYAGRCSGCGEAYGIGDGVVWHKGRGTWHARCHEAGGA